MEPFDSDDEELAASLNLLTQRQLDAARVQVCLLFYEDHALLWSSLEQTFPFWDERRLNRAIAYLEEVDAVEVDPAPAPNPWSPDDALVSVCSTSNTKLPLPWPGAHIHSPQYPATPAPPTFGFTSLIPSEGDDGISHEYPFSVPSSAQAFSQQSATPGLRRGLSEMGNRSMTDIFRFGSGLGMGLGMTGQPDLGLIPVTVTPPSSDSWFSQGPSEFVSPNLAPVKLDDFSIGIRPLEGDISLGKAAMTIVGHPCAKDGSPIGLGFTKSNPSRDGMVSPVDLSGLKDLSLTESELMMRDYDSTRSEMTEAAVRRMQREEDERDDEVMTPRPGKVAANISSSGNQAVKSSVTF